VETHWHLWNSSLRPFLVEDDPARDYMAVTIALGPSYRPEDTAAATLLGVAEALSAGMTTVHDWCHNVRGPEYADTSIRTLAATGIRARFSYGWPQKGDLTRPMDADGLREIHRTWFRDPTLTDRLIHLGIASRNLVPGQSARGAIDIGIAHQDWAVARELGVPITLHASPHGLVTMLDGEHLLGSDVLLVHPMLTTPSEDAIVAERGTSWSMSTIGEVGRGPEQQVRFFELDQAKATMGLSVDTSTSVPADFFASMRMLHRANSNRLGPDTGVTYRRMLELATIDGAKALGIDGSVGSLTPGKRADLIMVDRTALNMGPAGDPVTALVGRGLPSNVTTVLVDGRVLLREGRHVAMDPAEIMARATESARAVAARAAYAG
jgi:cytosine/adenosine deaminase-related metal-dependent hydrolase